MSTKQRFIEKSLVVGKGIGLAVEGQFDMVLFPYFGGGIAQGGSYLVGKGTKQTIADIVRVILYWATAYVLILLQQNIER